MRGGVLPGFGLFLHCISISRRRLVVEPVCVTELLLQGCRLTQYTEGYTKTLLELARKVRAGSSEKSQPKCFPYPDAVSSYEP